MWCADCHNLNIGGSKRLANPELGFKAHSERTHPVPYMGAFNGPGQCYSCHRSDLPRVNAGDPCSQCHYGTGSYYENRIDSTGYEYVASDFPHSGEADDYKMLGSYSVDVANLAPTTIVESVTVGPNNLDAVCLRCHWPQEMYHDGGGGSGAVGAHSVPVDCSVCHIGGSDDLHGGTPNGCGTCHDAAVVTDECFSCHPDKANPDGTVIEHGYSPEMHTSSETCLLACHDVELKPLHEVGAAVGVLAMASEPAASASSDVCTLCHDAVVASIQPWDRTCAACHATAAPAAHPTPEASHAGSDALVRDYTSNFPVRTSFTTRSYPFGCSPTPTAGQTICHDLSNLAELHQAESNQGCAICHGSGSAAPVGANECLTCHGTGWYAPSVSKGTVARPGSDFSSSGTITRVGGSGSDNFSTLTTNDGATSHLRFASTNTEAMFGRGTWWLNPNTTAVTSVQVLFRAMKLTAGTTASRMTAVMNVGGTTYVSAAVATNPSVTAYTLYTHTFATNPKTGVAWTTEDLNNPDSVNGLRAFGLRQTLSDTANIGVTEVLLKVNTPDTTYAMPPTSGGQAHHYGNYLRSPQTADGEWSSAIYTQYCYDRCHVYPNAYAYYGQVLGNPTYNPFNAYEGTQMWSSLMGDPNGNSPTVRNLKLEEIDLPAGSATLEFMTNYSLGNGDYGYVEISTDGGSNWATLSGIEAGAPVSVFSGIAGSWRPASYDLSAYAGQPVSLRFRYTNTASATNAGWCIDNVSVSVDGTVLFSDDAETLKPEWDPASHWRRIQYALRWLG